MLVTGQLLATRRTEQEPWHEAMIALPPRGLDSSLCVVLDTQFELSIANISELEYIQEDALTGRPLIALRETGEQTGLLGVSLSWRPRVARAS